MVFPFLDYRPRVALLRLTGVIAPPRGGVLGGGTLSLQSVAPLLARAFAIRRLSAVFLVINSPGGSPVQSSLIAGRIRALATEHKVPVIACVEDAAASGGYWLACAADEILADPASILGSIGVIASGFGFAEALEKLGVERRVRTAGTEKSFWDPFRPESPEDAARLHDLLGALHEEFRAWVRDRRGGKLTAPEEELFSGRFWTGRRAVELGLADRLGADPVAEAKRRFGKGVRIIPVGTRRPPFWRRLVPPGLSAHGVLTALEERAAWARLGL